MRKPFSVQNQTTERQIDLTPMLDVIFIMLIFFIVTASFVNESGLNVTQSKASKNEQQQSSKSTSIPIKITANDRILIDQRDIDMQSVRANLERLHAEFPDAPVVIKAHKEAKTATVVYVFDQAKQSGTDVILADSFY